MSESSTDDFDDYDEVEGVSGFVVLILGTLILAIFGLSIFLAYQHGMQSREMQLPRIAADPNPVKTERELSVGTAQDAEVFDRLEGVTKSEIVVAAEASSDPLEGFSEVSSAAGGAADSSNEAAAKALGDAVHKVSPPSSASLSADEGELTVPEELRTARATPRIKPQAPASPSASTSSKIADNSDAEKIADPKTIEDVLRPAGASVDRPASALAPVLKGALKGSHLVQVAAFRSDADAKAHYAKLKKKFGAIVADKAIHVERADLQEKGIYYRLRLGPFSSKGAAASYCTQLKNGGQDCIVKGL